VVVTSLGRGAATTHPGPTALAVLVAVMAYALHGPSPVLGAMLGAAALLPALWPARMRLGLGGQVLMVLVLAALGIIATTSLFVPPSPLPLGMLRAGWSTLAACLLLAATGRLYLGAPAGGQNLTLVVALLALAASGGSLGGPSYPVLIGAFLAAAALARRCADPASAPWSAVSRRWVLGVVLGASCAVAAALGATVVLPEAQSWVLARLMHAARERTGFSTRLWLGSLRGLALSDEIVMRVHGPATDYLRGVVLTRYDAGSRGDPGRWSVGSAEAATRRPMPDQPAAAGVSTEVELLEDDPERYFLPLDAVDVAIPSGLANVDSRGVLTPVAAFPADRYWFRTEAGRLRELAVPGADDLQIPAALLPTLRDLGGHWSAEAADDAARLAAIERHLQTEYHYSLDFERTSPGDPLVEFLLQSREGHCEYFATAMVLLSRAIGVPARLVGGYRVTEHDALGGYDLVRQRNAHTWVEAWVPGEGWRRFDPTPPAELALAMPTATPFASAVGDLFRSWGAAALRWLDRRSALQMVTALLLLVAFGLGVRWLRALRERRSTRAPVPEAAPLPCFETLCAELARRGVVRAPHEPVEALARRVLDSELPRPAPAEAAELVLRYAALRYGGIGEAEPLAADVAGFVQRLATNPLPSPR
jgi:protein-glutamine gamma-glutamyltransferase